MENEKKEGIFKKYFNVKTICANGIVAALYFVLTIACGPLSYEFMQFRFSELLNLLVFFNPTYTLGLTLGCLFANLLSTVGPIDILLGTATTFVACVFMSLFSRFIKNLFFAGFIPCLLNAIVVPFTIYISTIGTENPILLEPATYFVMFGWVLLGEVVCILVVGYPIFLLFTKKNKSFHKVILSTRNLDYKW